MDFSSTTLHICVLHLCKLFTSTASYGTETNILWDKHLFIPFGTEQLWICFDDLHADIGKELSFAGHLFHASQDFTITSLQTPLSQAAEPYLMLLHLVQKLFHWPFSKYSWSSPFISSESCTWYWSEMHQRVEKVAPGHSVYLSISFPVWLFLKVHLLFLTTVQTELSSLPIDLIKFICDNSGLIIYFYPLLTLYQPTHTKFWICWQTTRRCLQEAWAYSMNISSLIHTHPKAFKALQEVCEVGLLFREVMVTLP